ncbi:MAG: hypothetical protein ABWY26_13370 [Microbacterium sp.]
MAPIPVTVSVDDEHLDRLDDVVRRLRERGMTVDHVLVSLGIVTGSIEDVGLLDDVEGVLRVDLEGRKGVPPPDEEIQ